MPKSRALVAVLLCFVVPFAALAAEYQWGYSVTYAGGSLPNVKGGESLKLYIDSRRVRLLSKTGEISAIPANAITEVSYGQEVRHRIGTGAAVAVVSLGIGAMVAFSKSKKHYIGITWADGDNTGGIALQADKNEYRGLLGALQGVSGRTVVDGDSPRASSQENQAPPIQDVKASAATPPPIEIPRGIVVRITSIPTDAEVNIDGAYWGSTPTSEMTRLAPGPHTILVTKLNYQPWERKITLEPGDNRTVGAELQLNDASKPRISGMN